MKDEGILKDALVFISADTLTRPEALDAELQGLVQTWASEPGFEIAAARYNRSKGAMNDDAANALAYVFSQLLIARHYDSAIVSHPDRWCLYDYLFERQVRSKDLGRSETVLFGAPAAEGGLVSRRAASARDLAAALPLPAPAVSILRYGATHFPSQTSGAMPPFNYEFCVALRAGVE